MPGYVGSGGGRLKNQAGLRPAGVARPWDVLRFFMAFAAEDGALSLAEVAAFALFVISAAEVHGLGMAVWLMAVSAGRALG